MSTRYTIWAHAQEVWDKSDKDWGRKMVTPNSKNDLPLATLKMLDRRKSELSPDI